MVRDVDMRSTREGHGKKRFGRGGVRIQLMDRGLGNVDSFVGKKSQIERSHWKPARPGALLDVGHERFTGFLIWLAEIELHVNGDKATFRVKVIRRKTLLGGGMQEFDA